MPYKNNSPAEILYKSSQKYKDYCKLKLLRRRKKAQDLISSIKSTAICADCKQSFPPEVFQFDHINPRCLSGMKRISQLSS